MGEGSRPDVYAGEVTGTEGRYREKCSCAERVHAPDALRADGSGFARLARGDLCLLLNVVGGSGGAAQSMPDDRRPESGGRNRIQIEVHDLPALVERLRLGGAHFRNNIVSGNGGKQILLDDPSDNLIELFEPYQE